MIQDNQRIFLINHIVDEMTGFLMSDFNLELAASLKKIYESNLYEKLQDEKLDLYIQSPSYVYELLKAEIGELKS